MITEIFQRNWNRIKDIYESGQICSERHFQAELYSILKNKLIAGNANIFIEPIISSNDNDNVNELKGIIPDMIATQGDLITAIIELKYVPHGFVSFEKDIRNLSKFYKAKNNDFEYYLLTDKNTGDWNKIKTFKLSHELILIYVLIGNNDAYCITNQSAIWQKEYTGLETVPDYLQLTGSIDSIKNTITFYETLNIQNKTTTNIGSVHLEQS